MNISSFRGISIQKGQQNKQTACAKLCVGVYHKFFPLETCQFLVELMLFLDLQLWKKRIAEP